MSSNLVTIILPVYNCRDSISDCIKSILNQDYKKTEIIIVDDGSTDDTLQVINAFSENYNNIHIFHTENHGVSHARNFALEKASGDYYLFMDSDDQLAEEAISKLVDAAVTSGADLVTGKYATYYDDNKTLKEVVVPAKYCNKAITEKEFWEIVNLPGIYIGSVVWSKLYKAKVWENVKFNDDAVINGDEYVLDKYVANCNSFYFLDYAFYIQYIHRKSEGISGKPFRFQNLIGAEARVNRMDYLLSKDLYEAAFSTFSFGARILLNADKNLKDKKSKEEITRLYKAFKRLIPKLYAHVNFKDRLRLLLFCLNLKIYGYIRNKIAKSHK